VVNRAPTPTLAELVRSCRGENAGILGHVDGLPELRDNQYGPGDGFVNHFGLAQMAIPYCTISAISMALIGTATPGVAPVIVKGELGQKLDGYLAELADKGTSGAYLVAKDGEVLLANGYGLANREKNIPVTPDTVFDIGSITKQFTAAAILKLEMQGKLSVDDPITQYFVGVPEERRATTLHHLLTHSAAMPDSLGGDYMPMKRATIIEQALESQPKCPPGERYRYSNVGYSLLGAIVEMVSGASYEEYLRENLFLPADMTQTGYLLPDWRSGQLAHGYRLKKDWGTPLDHRWDTDGPYWNLRANGGILSTVWDLYKWQLALAGTEVLSSEAKKKLFTPHIVEREGGDSYYAYGWVWTKTSRNTTLITHNGGNGVFFADFYWYVDENVVLILMTNAKRTLSYKDLHGILRILFTEPETTP
jgi:CubicO group peptidase (beta-lactamase class C family)